MGYKVELNKKSYKFLKKVDKNLRERIKNKLLLLKNNPNLGKSLRYTNYFSLRIGDYRVIYEIIKKEKKIVVLFIGHRKHVYTEFDKIFLIFF